MAKWTVLIYMVANLDAELDAAAVRDLQEIERGMKRRTDDDVRVIVQIKRNWPKTAQRYEITRGGAQIQPVATGAQTDQSTRKIQKLENENELKAFLSETLVRFPKKSEDDKYLLVLWGHSYGLGFGRDHGDALTLKELAAAIGAVFPKPDKKLDLLGANACAMGYVEAACEFADSVKYMVASQIAVPYAGWPYHSILFELKGTDTPADFGKLIVEHYVNSFGEVPTGDRVTMSLYALGTIKELESRFKDLADALLPLTQGKDLATRLAHLRAAFRVAAAGEVRPLLDLSDLCCRLQELAADLYLLELVAAPVAKRLRTAAGEMREFLKRGDTGFIIAHQKHEELEGLHGVGVFAPFVTDELDLERLELVNPRKDDIDEYKALKLVQPTWATLVYDTLGANLAKDVLTNTASSGAASRADRRAVSQILVTVNALFDVLDRRVEAAREALLSGRAPLPATNGTGPSQVEAKPTQFPALRLLGYEALQEESERRAKLQASGVFKSTSVSASSNGQQIDLRAASTFKDVEAMLGSVERAVARTLTDRTYGLGPGVGRDAAGFGGERDDAGKPAGSTHGDPRKPAGSTHGEPRKPAGSTHGRKPAGSTHGDAEDDGNGTEDSSPEAVVARLFSQVGTAFADLETALGELETVAARALIPVAAGPSFKAVPTEAPVEMQLKGGFDLLRDASAGARRILKSVLADEVYGIGPGPGGITVDDRQAMARAGGFSSSRLTLLSARPEAPDRAAPPSPRGRALRKNSPAKRTVKKAVRQKRKRPRN